MIEQLFRGLLRIDHDLNVVPELAQNMNVSADGLTYLFMLREDACWSDGHPLTAGDFVYAWRKLREEGHVTAFLLDDIASAEALDDWTLEVHLREPRNYFPYVLASHWSLPLAAPPRRRGRGGLAPARVARRQRAVRALRGRRGGRAPEREPPLAHGLGQRRRGAHRLPRPRRRAARASGSRAATTCSSCGTRRSPPPNTIAERSPTLSTTFLGFNVRTPADGGRARAPRTGPCDRQRGAGGRRRRVSISPPAPAARSRPSCRGTATAPGLAYDLERARELLAEAGYPGRRRPAGAARGRAPVVSDGGARRAARRRRRARALRDAGQAFRRLAGRRTRGSPAGTRTIPDPDGFYLGLFELGLPLYRDEETDAVLAQARASRDRDERLRLYREFERIWIGQRAALVPISYARQLVLRRPERARPEAEPDGRVPPRAGRGRVPCSTANS